MKKVNTLCNSLNLNKLYLNENNSSKYIKNIQLTLREKLTSQDDHRNKINCMIDSNKEGNSCIDLSRNSAFLRKENRAPEQETSVGIKSMVNCSIFAVTDMRSII